MNSISIENFKHIQGNCNIVDIRSIQSYNNNHIPNSINIPFEKILINPSNYLDKNQIYYIYCQKGISSKNLCDVLVKSGYSVFSVDGGYENWILNN